MSARAVEPAAYRAALCQFVALCKTEGRAVASDHTHKCQTSKCVWVKTQGLPEETLLYFCSESGTQHLCGPTTCQRKASCNGSVVCKLTGRILQATITAGSAYEPDSSGVVIRAGVQPTSGITADTGGAPSGARRRVQPSAVLDSASALVSKTGVAISARDTSIKKQILRTVVLLLSSKEARQCRQESISKKKHEVVQAVSTRFHTARRCLKVINIAVAIQQVLVGWMAVFNTIASPMEDVPTALVEDLVNNVLLMLKKFILDVEDTAAVSFVQSSQRADPPVEAFTHVCLTLMCNGFDDKQHGFKIEPSPTLSRFLIQSPMVTRLTSTGGSLVRLLASLKSSLHTAGPGIGLVALRGDYYGMRRA